MSASGQGRGREIRWGILGTGRIAEQFVRDLAFVGNGRAVAVASRSQEAAERFAAGHGVPRAWAGYQRLLEDPAVDAVYIATPHSLHLANASAAAEAGKHVLCEKPLTLNAAECERLMQAAAHNGVYLMEAMWTWFLPAIRQARAWVAQGRIGALRHVKADFGYPQLPFDARRREYDADLGGGCLLEMGIYPIALALLFTGLDPESIHVVAHRAPNGVEDDLSMLFDYGDANPGCFATLGTSFRCKLQNWAYLVGEEGYIAIPDFWRARSCRLYRLDECLDVFEDPRESLGLAFETEAASADILGGRLQSDVVPLGESLRLQTHMDRVRQLI